jgi:hypothetical protein
MKREVLLVLLEEKTWLYIGRRGAETAEILGGREWAREQWREIMTGKKERESTSGKGLAGEIDGKAVPTAPHDVVDVPTRRICADGRPRHNYGMCRRQTCADGEAVPTADFMSWRRGGLCQQPRPDLLPSAPWRINVVIWAF